ncbi:MAG: hypothetical protein HQL54_08255 [Magnetococcales bacterium]|nr:hypothetical protein [Magnetococcales bacterium]
MFSNNPQLVDANEISEWPNGIRNYFNTEICQPAARCPTFGITNENNRIPEEETPKHLVHIASFDNLLRRFLSSTAFTKKRQQELFNLTDLSFNKKANIDDLANNLHNCDGLVLQQAIGLILSSLVTQPPWWCAPADELTDYLGIAKNSGDATKLCQALGMGHIKTGERILIWHYPASRAGGLFRPTVLEAGDNAFHFPSPPGKHFGQCMPLALGIQSVREAVHRPLDRDDITEFLLPKIAKVYGDVLPEDINTLSQIRSKHRQTLLDHYSEAPNWLRLHPIMSVALNDAD